MSNVFTNLISRLHANKVKKGIQRYFTHKRLVDLSEILEMVDDCSKVDTPLQEFDFWLKDGQCLSVAIANANDSQPHKDDTPNLHFVIYFDQHSLAIQDKRHYRNQVALTSPLYGEYYMGESGAPEIDLYSECIVTYNKKGAYFKLPMSAYYEFHHGQDAVDTSQFYCIKGNDLESCEQRHQIQQIRQRIDLIANTINAHKVPNCNFEFEQ